MTKDEQIARIETAVTTLGQLQVPWDAASLQRALSITQNLMMVHQALKAPEPQEQRVNGEQLEQAPRE